MSEYLKKSSLAKQDRPDVQIFMALLQSNLWRPSDSGRRIVLDWLHYVARTSLASCHSHGVMERREAFKAALAAEDTEVPRHPSQVLPGGHRRSGPYSFRMWPDKVQALVTYDTMRLNDPTLPWSVRNGRYMPVGLHTPRLTVVAVKNLHERNMPGVFAYFFAEPEEPGPVFFESLPPSQFRGARPKSSYSSTCMDRMANQLQALADVFSDHEKFIHEQLHPFFERSSNLENAPAWGIVDAAFLRHVMANIKRWPTLDDCRAAVKEEQQQLCNYIETIRFNLHTSLADKLQKLGAISIPDPDG